MRILLVDNHDSYTYNLFQLLARVAGTEPTVITNDAPDWRRLDLDAFDAAVISPGPGRPQRARDVGRAAEPLRQARLPVLGVCLGHQLLAHLLGADVALAPAPRHGHLTRVRHDGTGLFDGLPQDFTAVRYHSLAVTEPLPADLAATAWAEDGVVMGVAHRHRPQWGVQFHPESVASAHGREIIANFLELARAVRPYRPPTRHSTTGATRDAEQPRRFARPETATPPPGDAAREVIEEARVGDDLLLWCRLPGAVDTERVFHHLYADREHAVWLDSSRTDPGEDTARFSFLGVPDGPRGEILSYRVGDGSVTVTGPDGAHHHEPGTIFDVLDRRVAHHPVPPPAGLPFDFTGGYVGYLGYELKAYCGGAAAHRAPTPDAVLARVDRFVAVDHHAQRTYVVARTAGPRAEARRWVAATATAVRAATTTASPPAGPSAPPLSPPLPEPRPGLSRADYLARVKECLGLLAEGESYEICLTDRLRTTALADDLAFYRALRRANPAPYAALLRLGELTVHSASPERFLRVEPGGMVESRPIKGTAARVPGDPAADAARREWLRADAKTRAENLMIVDLLRNDLGRVCATGSVTVPDFMYTRSYATVHQLVSTVRGRLRDDVGPVGAVRACFPPGSMTGAPKVRTMELLDRLESGARGVYSGALGYFGYDGTVDLGVVIRTAVRYGGELVVGAGGAIVLDSDPEEEYAEMRLKAAVPLRGAAPPVIL